MMKLRAAIGALLLLSLSAFGAKSKILEARDIRNFRVVAKKEAGGAVIMLSGLAFHSALAVKGGETKREGNVMVLDILLVPAREGVSGSFAFSVRVPRGVERVLFGAERVEIWPKRADLER